MQTKLHRAVRRLAWVAVLMFIALFASVSPASAHGASASGASNYRTTITAISPATWGISVASKENGDRLQLMNHSGHEVIILGYQGEPYLKVTTAGVFENRLSPAVYMNANRYGITNAPAYVDAKAPPRWHKVSTGHVAVWHDHRAHWMATTPPPIVMGDQSAAHVIVPDWSVPFTVDGAKGNITGTVEWIPPLAKWKWLTTSAIAAACIAGLLYVRKYTTALCLGVAVLIVADVLHVLGVFVGGAGEFRTRLGAAVTGDAASVLVWCTGIWTLHSLGKRRYDVAGYSGLFTAVAILLFGGITDIHTLWDSQVVFGWSPWLARAVVALTLGCGVSTVGASALVINGSVARTRFSESGDRHDDASSDNQGARAAK